MILRMNYRMHYNSKDKDFGEERYMLNCRELRDKWRKYSIAELREFGSEKEKINDSLKRGGYPQRTDHLTVLPITSKLD